MFESGNRRSNQSQTGTYKSSLHHSDPSNPERSRTASQSNSLPANGFSRVYPAKASAESRKAETRKEPNITGNRSGSLSSGGGNVEETRLNRSSSSSRSDCQSQKVVVANLLDPDSSERSGDIHSIIKKFSVPSTAPVTVNATTVGHAAPKSGHRSNTGGRYQATEEARSSSVQNKVKVNDPFSANKNARKHVATRETLDPVAPDVRFKGVSTDLWKGHRTDFTTGGSVDEEEDDLAERSSDVISGVSTPTSGYATDHLSDQSTTDHFRNDVRPDDLSLSQMRLGSDSGNTEPDDHVIVIRTFEAMRDGEVGGDEDHPYFARVAAEAEEPTPILSRSGSFRGVKNRVRAGIASLLDKRDGKKSVNYSLSEKGKVVFYTTSVTVVRDTFDKCHKIKRILKTQMVEFDERDVFMSKNTQQELADRLHPDVELPQVFVDGYHLGGAEEIERLNETGTLRRIFNHFKKVQQPECCIQCGGYRFIPCHSCHGSKKSKRNCFTDEFCALRCIKCDDNGLVKCNMCNGEVDNDEPRQD